MALGPGVKTQTRTLSVTSDNVGGVCTGTCCGDISRFTEEDNILKKKQDEKIQPSVCVSQYVEPGDGR